MNLAGGTFWSVWQIWRHFPTALFSAVELLQTADKTFTSWAQKKSEQQTLVWNNYDKEESTYYSTQAFSTYCQYLFSSSTEDESFCTEMKPQLRSYSVPHMLYY